MLLPPELAILPISSKSEPREAGVSVARPVLGYTPETEATLKQEIVSRGRVLFFCESCQLPFTIRHCDWQNRTARGYRVFYCSKACAGGGYSARYATPGRTCPKCGKTLRSNTARFCSIHAWDSRRKVRQAALCETRETPTLKTRRF